MRPPIDFDFPVKIERNARRKHLAIQISYGEVVVKAPVRLPRWQINKLINSKLDWINRELAAQVSHKRPQPIRFDEGERLLYLGQSYQLQFITDGAPCQTPPKLRTSQPTSCAHVQLESGRILLRLPLNLNGEPRRTAVQKILTSWYRSRALGKFTERTQHYAAVMRLEHGAIKIRSYKSRWGSCNLKKDITYNWRLIMAPPEILDYVVVHELCHILQYNHSPKYWAKVIEVLPDYQKRSMWLKRHGETLTM